MHRRPVDTRSTTPHSQIAVASRPVRARQAAGALVGIAAEELDWVFAHDDAQVVLGLGEHPVGVDQLEPGSRLERVPLVDVTVHEHGTLVVMRVDASPRRVERMVDGARRARAVEPLPGAGDEVDEPSALVRTGGEPGGGRGSPHPSRRRGQDLVSPVDRERELVEGAAEMLQEQRVPARIGAEEPHATITVR